MDRVPFSVYDIFGCLIPGFLLIVACDYALGSGTLLHTEPSVLAAFFLATVAYVCGHLIAGAAGLILERGLVRRLLKPPEVLLFRSSASRWRWLFPGYYEPLPEETQRLVLKRVAPQLGDKPSPRALFYLCLGGVKGNETTERRLQTFLYLYGFCRNLSAACLLAGFALAANGWLSGQLGLTHRGNTVWWVVAALVASIGLFYRYLKFFRHYTVEVFRSYPLVTPVTNSPASADVLAATEGAASAGEPLPPQGGDPSG